MNNLLTARSGKPRERTNITGGVAYDPYAAPGQPVAVTPVGQADIGATQALAAQRYADAGESSAHAALYGRTDPNRLTGRAAERNWQVESLESELGRKLTSQELIDLASNKLNTQVPATSAPSSAVGPTSTPATRAWSQADALQALADAREAVKRGALTLCWSLPDRRTASHRTSRNHTWVMV